jgi:PadR family transcriptional regulator AphA
MSPLTSTPLTTELALLGFLTEQPMHGYELFRRMGDPHGPGAVWHVKQPQLYALLNRMEAEGLIEGVLQELTSRPQRRQYSLTQAGSESFTAWLVDPVSHARDMRIEFMLKLYFSRRHNPQSALCLVEAQQTACRQWYAMQQVNESDISIGSSEQTIRGFRAAQLRAMLTWLDDIYEDIRQQITSYSA